MFFILSKVFAILIMPFTLIILIFIAGVVIRNSKWKKRLIMTAFFSLLFFSNDFIANEFMLRWEIPAKPFNSIRKFKLGIVLTGATIEGLQPDDRVYFHRGADRVFHTVQLYKLGLIEKILISGGTGILTGAEEPEANKFQKVMVMMGVPGSDIIIENETRNTAESAIEVRKLIDQLGYKSNDCLLITSAFHMRRSLASYRKAGLSLESFSCDFYAHERSFYPDGLLIPQLDAMNKWHKLAKEWVGFAAYKIAGYI
jgi:uncharacterized SAM-binding protein YcdF (DUF218 family)